MFLTCVLLLYFRYAKFCNLDAPSDDIVVVLDKFSQRIGALKKGEPVR